MFDENEIARDQTWQEPKDAENERDEQENQKEEEDDDDNDESLVESRIPRNMSGSIMKVRIHICVLCTRLKYRKPLYFITSFNQETICLTL